MRGLKIPMIELEELSRQVSEKGGRLRFECRLWGTSMSPGIRHGDILAVEFAGNNDVEVGDVVVYMGDRGRHVAHRLVRRDARKGKPALVARSDANGARDEIVHPENLVGRVVGVKRGGALRRSASIVSEVLRALIRHDRTGT